MLANMYKYVDNFERMNVHNLHSHQIII